MKAPFKQNAFVRFAVVAGLMYLVSYLIYQFVVKRYTYYDQQFIGGIIKAAESFLNLIGYKTFTVLQDRDLQVIGIDGGNGVWIGSNCNAITLFTLFSVFVIAYPGHQKSKWWFIPTGLFLIHVFNIIRVISLVLIARYFPPEYLDFNHTYTFTFLVYAFIFWLWMIWVNKFSDRKNKEKT